MKMSIKISNSCRFLGSTLSNRVNADALSHYTEQKEQKESQDAAIAHVLLTQRKVIETKSSSELPPELIQAPAVLQLHRPRFLHLLDIREEPTLGFQDLAFARLHFNLAFVAN